MPASNVGRWAHANTRPVKSGIVDGGSWYRVLLSAAGSSQPTSASSVGARAAILTTVSAGNACEQLVGSSSGGSSSEAVAVLADASVNPPALSTENPAGGAGQPARG